jgi:murein DD-endopeptidase MepM/ murein hydrolase activator NlpD
VSWVEEKLRNPVVAGLAVASVGTLGYFGVRWILGGKAHVPKGVAPPRRTAVPFAELDDEPVWPIATNHPQRGQVAYTDESGDVHGNWARQFHVPREGDRWHVGIDLYSYAGDPVLAIADGTVVATQTFHLGTDAILVEHDGMVALYGEVKPNSWKEFGVGVGSRVRRGDPIARIGCMVGTMDHCESQMLHFESYVPGTRQNHQWHGSTPPSELRDPTVVLLAAAGPGANVA